MHLMRTFLDAKEKFNFKRQSKTRLVTKISVRRAPGNVRPYACASVLRNGVRCHRLRDGGCHDIVSRVTHLCHTNTSHVSAVSHSILNNEPSHVNQLARINFN